MTDKLAPYSKAIAAVVTPIVLTLIAWAARKAGIDEAPDPTAVGAVVTSAVTGLLVYLVRNRQST